MFDCVMLAAGASSRMRGGFKPLLPFMASPMGGTTLVETAVLAARGSGAKVILVVGNRGSEVTALFDAPRYREECAEALLILENPAWERGMIGSIQAALPQVRGGAFFVAHADMPFVRPDDYRALAARLEGRHGAGETAVMASHGGEWGHPVLLPAAWIPEILALAPGDRLRPFVAARAHECVETGAGAMRDIDTPEDYAAALAGRV
jgi:CTP:molybdopterin cytidylyltransferase MocA